MYSFLVCRLWHHEMHIPILTGVQNIRINRWRNGHTLIKKSTFEACFPRQRSLVLHIPILTGVQNERISKIAKIMHIFSIGLCIMCYVLSIMYILSIASNCCLEISIKNFFFFVFVDFAFLYISNMQVLKSR